LASGADRDVNSTAVPVWSKIFKLMTVTSSSRVLSGGTTVTARNVGDWKGAARAAQSTANRAHFSNLASSAFWLPARAWYRTAIDLKISVNSIAAAT
jgi:hypothetical protein